MFIKHTTLPRKAILCVFSNRSHRCFNRWHRWPPVRANLWERCRTFMEKRRHCTIVGITVQRRDDCRPRKLLDKINIPIGLLYNSWFWDSKAPKTPETLRLPTPLGNMMSHTGKKLSTVGILQGLCGLIIYSFQLCFVSNAVFATSFVKTIGHVLLLPFHRS